MDPAQGAGAARARTGPRRSRGSSTRPERSAGPITRVLYLAYVGVALTVAVTGLSVHYRDPRLVGSPPYLDLLESLNVPIALATTVSFVVPITAAAVLACAVFLGRRDDAMALLFAAGLLGLYVFYSASPRAVALTYPRLAAVAALVEAVGLACVVVVLYVFPDGRFRPPWTRPVAAVLVTVLLFVPDLPATARLLIVTPDTLTRWKVVLVVLVLLTLLATALPAQALRYRRHATLVGRQQQRWILFGLATVLVPAGLSLVGAALDAPWTLWVVFAMALLGSVLPAASAVALFHYRLFDLDRVVSRTLSWTALTVFLAVAYGLLILVLQALLAPLAGGSDLAVAFSTLAVAALFATARRRVQAFVDRSFYRARYDAQQVVREFGDTLRGGLPRDELVASLTQAVHRTFQPTAVGVWLREPPRAEAVDPGSSGRSADARLSSRP
jgi:hypothetical protein